MGRFRARFSPYAQIEHFKVPEKPGETARPPVMLVMRIRAVTELSSAAVATLKSGGSERAPGARVPHQKASVKPAAPDGRARLATARGEIARQLARRSAVRRLEWRQTGEA